MQSPVPVMDEILPGSQEGPLFHGHIAGHLDHPCLIGMRRDASHVDLPTAEMQEKQDVIHHESTQRPDLSREKIQIPLDLVVKLQTIDIIGII